MVNVWGLSYVIPDRAWPPSGEESEMSRPALTARKMDTEEADPARVMAIAAAVVDGIG